MSGIEAFATLFGVLSCSGGLSGKISVPTQSGYDSYTGEYEIVPNAFKPQTLLTANKVLAQNVVIQKVPYYETSNAQNGVTVYIAEGGK